MLGAVADQFSPPSVEYTTSDSLQIAVACNGLPSYFFVLSSALKSILIVGAPAIVTVNNPSILVIS